MTPISQLPESIQERAIPLIKKAWDRAGNDGDPDLTKIGVEFIDKINAPEGRWYWEAVMEGNYIQASSMIREGYVLNSLFTKGIQKKILYLQTESRSLSFVHRGYLRPILKSQVCYSKSEAEEKAVKMFQDEVKKLHHKIEKYRREIVNIQSKK